MKIYITPDTVRRERFGGIVGTVTQVSPFPITKEGASSLVGNAEVVEEIVSQVGSVIAVQAQLELDPSTPSGYKWSSSTGPKNLESIFWNYYYCQGYCREASSYCFDFTYPS